MKPLGENFNRCGYAVLVALLGIGAIELAIVILAGYGCDDINYGTFGAIFITIGTLGLPILVPGIAGAFAGYRLGRRAAAVAAILFAVAGVSYVAVPHIPHHTIECKMDL